jgi:hypothetical protein
MPMFNQTPSQGYAVTGLQFSARRKAGILIRNIVFQKKYILLQGSKTVRLNLRHRFLFINLWWWFCKCVRFSAVSDHGGSALRLFAESVPNL